MKSGLNLTGWALAVLFSVLWLAVPQQLDVNAEASGAASIRTIKRVGMVVGLNESMMNEYKRLHSDDYAGVRDLLGKYNMHNFSIFLHEIDGKYYEFGYYDEYTGNDFDGDMAKLDAEPRNKEWLKVCDPMQVPLEGETSWDVMDMVYHNDLS